MKKLLAITAVCAGLTLWFAQARSHAQPELKTVMKAKLGHAQALLEGLAQEDYKKLRDNAEALSFLSQADAWNVHKTPEYLKLSKDFQAVTDSMAANAKAKKLEAVTLDYVQMTMLCVKCHSYTRKAGLALQDRAAFSSEAVVGR